MGYESKQSYGKIYRNSTLVILATLCLAPVLAQSAFAISYGDPVPMAQQTGEIRCFSSNPAACAVGDIGLVTTPVAGSGWGDATLEWDITLSAGVWTYEYTLTDFSQGDVSHLTIDISDDLDCDDITDAKLNGVALVNDQMKTEKACGNFEGITGALKLDVGGTSPLVYEFKTTRSPVFYDVFVKSGQFDGNNIGFPAHTSTLEKDYIAAPNSDETPPGGNGMKIGGEFIGVDTTAVLMAGAQSTAAWMIPVIIAAAGLGIVIARKF